MVGSLAPLLAIHPYTLGSDSLLELFVVGVITILKGIYLRCLMTNQIIRTDRAA
jgi:hypothetical protein